MLQLLWNRIAYAGTQYAKDYAEQKHILLVNGLSIVSPVFTFITHLFFAQFYESRFLMIASYGYIFLQPLSIWFNSKGKLFLSRIHLILLSSSYLMILILTQGRETDSHLFLLVEILTVYFIFPIKEKQWKFIFVTILFLLYSIIGFYHKQMEPLIPASNSTLFYRSYLVEMSFAVLLIIFAFYINSIFQRSELATLLEQEKSERLLLNILPAQIVRKLRENSDLIAERFEYCTVLFSDIVGFTKISRNMSPDEVVELLNDIFSQFDDLVEKYNLEKIKTIGDAYMVVGGLPEPDQKHAENVANFAIDMLKVIEDYRERKGISIEIRIGINSGDAVAGVIGKKKFIYDLWGDSVNTASRMESHGMPGMIQVSNSTYELLKGKFKFKNRGSLEVKGLGKVQSYFLLEKAF